MNITRSFRTLGFLLDAIKQNENGGTISVSLGLCGTINGYVVGGAFPTLTWPIATRESRLDPDGFGALCVWLRALPESTRHIGFWAHDGVWHFDAVTIHSDIFEAITLGKQRGEIAIWDGFQSDEIVLSES